MTDPANCPLCGQLNECQLCTSRAYKGPCWCFDLEVPSTVLDRVPEESKKRACVCRRCIESALSEEHRGSRLQAKAGEVYFEAGMIVFTEAIICGVDTVVEVGAVIALTRIKNK